MRIGGAGCQYLCGSERRCDVLKLEQARKARKPTRGMSHHALPEDAAARGGTAFGVFGRRFPRGS
jgi:hypothetical protein